jgi:hypothetical protein
MAVNDFMPYDDGIKLPGSKRYAVVKGRTTVIKAGELVMATLGSAYVTAYTPGGAAKATGPSIGTDFIAGIATSNSTETNTANGVVDVMPLVPGLTFLVTPDTATTWNTQAKYDAYIGDRVKLSYSTAGKFTILADDMLTAGCVVEPLDIVRHPVKVRISFKQGLSPTY